MNVNKYIVCLSESDWEEMARTYPVDKDRIVVISDGVDIERFHLSDKTRAEKRAQLGARDDELDLLFVEHEFRRKELHLLIRASGCL